MNHFDKLISEYLKRGEKYVMYDLHLAKARQEILLKAAKMDRDPIVQRKSDLLSKSKIVLALGSIIIAAYGAILLALG
jgi:hypothetical protein